MRISDWSSDVCSSDLAVALDGGALHFLGDRVQLCARLLERELHVAGTLGPVHPHEGLARRAADREEAVVAHDQHFVVAEVAHDALALCEVGGDALVLMRSEAHTSELQSLMRISYAVFCLKKK